MNAKLTIINLPFKSHKCESKIFSMSRTQETSI